MTSQCLFSLDDLKNIEMGDYPTITAVLLSRESHMSKYVEHKFKNLKNGEILRSDLKYYQIWDVFEETVNMEKFWEGTNYAHEYFEDENLISILIDNKINLLLYGDGDIHSIAPYHVKKTTRILKKIRKRAKKRDKEFSRFLSKGVVRVES